MPSFVIVKVIFGIVGDIKSVTNLRNGNLIVKPEKPHQVIHLMDTHMLGNLQVKVEPHNPLTTSINVEQC